MAVLKMYNQISTEEGKMELLWRGSDGICFKDVDEFIESIAADDDVIDLRLHCAGGNTGEGWAIYDKLRATGKKITATIEGQCASMATIVLLAASERKGLQNGMLCIHEPYYPEYSLAEAYRAKDLQAMADDLKAETERFLDVYVERTGSDREALAALMEEDKYVDMNQALTLGFISEIVKPMSASKAPKAWGSKNNNNKKMAKTKAAEAKAKADKEQATVAKAFRMLGVALGVVKAEGEETKVALELDTESGDTLTVERESGDPQVGDVASPDGEFVMPDGSTITVADGVITDIVPAEEEKETDENADALAEALAENETLKAENATLKAAQKTSAEKKILNAVAIAGGEAWLKTATSGRQATARVPQSSKSSEDKPAPRESKVAKKLAELDAKKD